MLSYRIAISSVVAFSCCFGLLDAGDSSCVQIARAADVPWLEEVTQGPAVVPSAERGYLAPLSNDINGNPIKTLRQWRNHRLELRRAWYQFLGPMPEPPAELDLRILKEDRESGCLRQLVEYISESNQKVQGYLLSPLSSSRAPATEKSSILKHPALVALHQTTNDSIEEIAGLKGNKEQQIGPKLARRGFVVFCPRNYLWQDVDTLNEAVDKFKKRHPKTLGMRKMLYDAMRGVDVLESLPHVDTKRLGCVGHSLGGKEALYLAAFDDRIKATVASELGIGFKYTNWNAPWYLGNGINESGFELNHHQLIAMAAPRPFLLLAGESGGPGSVADGDRSWPYLAAAQPICSFYGQPVRIGMLNHREGHRISDATFEKLADWFETYLSNATDRQ